MKKHQNVDYPRKTPNCADLSRPRERDPVLDEMEFENTAVKTVPELEDPQSSDDETDDEQPQPVVEISRSSTSESEESEEEVYDRPQTAVKTVRAAKSAPNPDGNRRNRD